MRKAFEVLRSRPKSSPVGWFNYAGIHGMPSNDPDAPGLPALKSYWNPCLQSWPTGDASFRTQA